MTPMIDIKTAGAQSLIIDDGRDGLRHLGVPRGGAMDRISFALTNICVGNPWRAPAIECALTGPSLQFLERCIFALGGADFGATLNASPIAPYEATQAAPGDRLDLGAAHSGVYGYIAIAGGLDGDCFLNSRSTHLAAELGGYKGRVLTKGDHLSLGSLSTSSTNRPPKELTPRIGKDWVLRASHGPEAHIFEPAAYEAFFAKQFKIDQRGNRMGIQLNGPNCAPKEERPMRSSAVFPGTIQVPPAGDPFLLLADAQTLGGYPRIAQIIDADMSAAAQMRAGDRVWFRHVSPDEARKITQQKRAYYKDLAPGFMF